MLYIVTWQLNGKKDSGLFASSAGADRKARELASQGASHIKIKIYKP